MKNIIKGILVWFNKMAINTSIDLIEDKINAIDSQDLESFKEKVIAILDSKRV